jgi:pseudomonalisin
VQGSCGSDTSGDGEWQIDTQASAGMAPGNAGETLYFARSILDGDLNNSFVAWAHDPKGPKLASASLGECEASPANGVFTGPLGATDGNTSSGPAALVAFGNGEQAAIDPVLRTAVLTGKTLFASTGDTGSSCPLLYLPVIGAGNGVLNQGLPEQNYPAVSDSAVAVGGTVLYTNDNGSGAGSTYKPGKPATRAAEYAWTFGGGGASLYTPAPSWQTTVAGIVQPCVTSPTSVCRAVPDVAAQSGDVLTNGYSVVGSGGFTSGGGTSLSSPLWMGMWARVQGAAGRNLGFAAPLLYRAASTPAGYAASFTDVTLGGNGLHVASPGWDYTTGLGTPRVAGLIRTLLHHS